MPKTRQKTQKENILAYLQAGNSITPIEALNMFGCFRLADIIYKLKADGYIFNTETITEDDKHFSSYSLVVEEPEQAVLF